jgi:hypothetical protein
VELRDVEFIEDKFSHDSKDASRPNQTQESNFNANTSLSGNKRIENGS